MKSKQRKLYTTVLNEETALDADIQFIWIKTPPKDVPETIC